MPFLKLSDGFNAFATEATFLKLGMIVATVDLYAQIPLLVTFDLYVGHRGSKYVRVTRFQYLTNYLSHQDQI